MRAIVGVIVLLAATTSVRAQGISGGRAAIVSRSFADSNLAGTPMDHIAVASPARFTSALRPFAPLVSAIIPGGGQAILGNDRFVAYGAVEVLGWWKYLKDAHEEATQVRSYIALARVGRSNFSTTLPDGDWTYYEAMRDRLESGAYSMSATGPIQPETDTTTFNGSAWQLALRTNPDSASALAQYERLAIKPQFRWSWKNAQLQYDIFKRTTFKRDDAYYASIQDLIIIGANHVISMVDAFATFRLQVHTDADGRTTIGGRVSW